jgi:hypothetical protein
MDDVFEMIRRLSGLMERLNVDASNLYQLRIGLERMQSGYEVWMERQRQMSVTSATGGRIDVNRFIDVLSQDLFVRLHEEVKSGYRDIKAALKIDQLLGDAGLAIDHFNRTLEGRTGQTLQNIWRLLDHEFGAGVPQGIQDRLQQVVRRVVGEGFNFQQLQAAIGSFQFVDSAGRIIRAELNEKGETVFRDAMGVLLGTDGTLAQVALSAASHSPDFNPAMQVLFGPNGKVADAAHDAVAGTNLTPAMENLEEKVEQGVTGALNQAGDRARGAAAQSLGSRIGAGATALGNVMTSIPQLHQSVTALGEAWNKPLRSTADYMAVLGAAGGVVTQTVQVFQALAGVTQIASAAQAIFNAVMAMNPVVLIVMAVIALIAAIVLLIVYWDRVKAALRDNPWLAVAASLFGIIGLIVVIIAYWDEIKLAVLRAANFISIQIQRIGQFFVGLGRLAGMVWDYITASAVNLGIGIVNTFISIGTQIQNFFIRLVNSILEMYNAVATSAIGEFVGLEAAELIPEVDVQTRLIPPREVPEISVAAAFQTSQVTGGLEERIAAQEGVVQRAQAEDQRRREQRQRERAAAEAAAPAAPAGTPALPGAGAPATRPELPAGAVPAAAAAGPVDSSVTVNGGITVNINAERLEADAAQLLSDQMIRAIQERLGSLRSEQSFRTGVRAPAPA